MAATRRSSGVGSSLSVVGINRSIVSPVFHVRRISTNVLGGTSGSPPTLRARARCGSTRAG